MSFNGNLKSEFRDYKLKVIKDEIKFEVDNSRFISNKTIKFIKKQLPGDIISGSLALSLFGLYDQSKKTQKSLASVMNLTKNPNSNLELKYIV